MTRQRKPTRIEEARAAFCEARRKPSHLSRWMAWVALRGAIEGWTEDEVFDAQRLLVDAETWKRGFRPPATFSEASSRARSRHRSGSLGHSLGGGG